MDKKDKTTILMDEAVAVGLDGTELFAQLSFDEICAAYNGIGPEFLPQAIREKVTDWLALFEPAALIHDIRYTLSDGYRYGWNFANVELRYNCLRLANRAYPWYSWRRYRARQVAHILYRFVASAAGWKAWTEAADKNTQKKGIKA